MDYLYQHKTDKNILHPKSQNYKTFQNNTHYFQFSTYNLHCINNFSHNKITILQIDVE